MSELAIQNLIKRTDALQARMSIQEVRLAQRSEQSYQQLVEGLTLAMRESARAVEGILERGNQSPAALPVRSRRAYQWLAHLAEISHLEDHLDALQRVNLYLPGIKRLPRLRSARVEFSFYHLAAVYKFKQEKNCLEICAQEALVRAPDRVLIALLQTALAGNREENRAVIREYTFSAQYQAARTHLEYLGIPPGSFSCGFAHNLEDSFSRVNREYFQGGLARPHLVWNDRLTYRKFGHYQWDTDTVMVSRTLDQQRVPEYVVDYVMYHELLHKQLGFRRINNRSMSHTGKFRRAEGDYRRIREARDFLNRLSRKKS